MEPIKERNTLVFETTIPVFSWFITKVMGVGLLMTLAMFGIIAVFSIMNGGKFSDLTPDIYFALGFVGLIFFLTYLVMIILFPSGFISGIQISEDGVSQAASPLDERIGRVAIIGGVLTKSPGTIGTGLLAATGNNRIISWKDMSIVKVNSSSRYMYFSKGRLKLFPIGFFCPEKRYKETIELVTKYFPNFQLES